MCKFDVVVIYMKVKSERCFFNFLIQRIFYIFNFITFFYSFSQVDTSRILNFNFNNHQIKEAADKVKINPVGISLTEDRFGNKRSAIYLHGHPASYLNLGTSILLKPKIATISLWVNLDHRVYAGKGNEINPILITKNSPGDDFYCAYGLYYDCTTKRLGVVSHKDSVKSVNVMSVEEAVFNNWYHLVVTYNDKDMAFYVNGELQQKALKGYETIFLESDSVVIGNSANKKNDRWSQGVFDDIQIFPWVLNENEIKNLYEAPDPNRLKTILSNILFCVIIVSFILLVAYLLIANRRKGLKKEEEKLKLNRKLYEMETKVIKAQMNPHFMFNSLNTIQQFIISNENDKAQYYLSKFSRLIRKLLDSNATDSISLVDEIEILNRYLDIESLRFDNVFKFKIEADKRINPFKTFIPHFLVQPFVENAIWHGLLTKKGNKNLNIYFEFINEKKISCIIEDNGIGREKSKMKQNLKKKSLAISFIQQRLDLMNKNLKLDLTINIIDKINNIGDSEGTKVIITIPIIKPN